jgi:carbon storage regulator
MLVLSRKKQESVVVMAASGCEQMLKVTVLEIRSGCVRLGFDASAEVPVHRAEVWERIRAESQARHPTQVARRPQERPPECD